MTRSTTQPRDRLVEPVSTGRGPKMRHTPGPWIVEEKRRWKNTSIRYWSIVSDAGNQEQIGEVTTSQQDAALVAVAPGLFAAVKKLLRYVSSDDLPYHDIVETCEDALAHATGGQP